jgi:hypothetical protein
MHPPSFPPHGKVDSLQPDISDYEPPKTEKAKRMESKLEDDIWRRLLKARSSGQINGVNYKTRSNAAIAARCRELLEKLELYKVHTRDGGNDAPYPLNSLGKNSPNQIRPPVNKDQIKSEFQKLEEEFGGQRGWRVYGVPVNMYSSDADRIWEHLRNTDIVSLGDDESEYSVAVRVFAQPHKIFSIWVFLVCVCKG